MASTSSALPGQDAAKLEFPPPKDMLTECYQSVKDSARPKVFVNYPGRTFHLKPQFRNMLPGRDWEETFLWQKVSVPHMKAEYIDPFPLPGLDLPPGAFPEELHGRCAHLKTLANPDEQVYLRWVKDVLGHVETEAQFRERTAPRYTRTQGPGHDIREDAIGVLQHYVDAGSMDAEWIMEDVAQRQMLREELAHFIRFRDHDGVPNGLGFRPVHDTLYLDNLFLRDYLEREADGLAGGGAEPARLVSFMGGGDRANVSTLALSAAPFLAPRNVAALCQAVVRTFPNINLVRLVTTAVVDRDLSRAWDVDTRFVMGFQPLDGVVRAEIMASGGGPASGPGGRTPVVAYGLDTGLILDPSEAHYPEDRAPLVETVLAELAWQRHASLLQKRTRRGVAIRAAASKLAGTPTFLPRPVGRGPGAGRDGDGADPSSPSPSPSLASPRRYHHPGGRAVRMSRAEFERQRLEREARPRRPSPSRSVSTVELSNIIPAENWQLTVQPVVMAYYRDAFDRAVARGWRDVGPVLDLRHLGM